MKELDPQLKGLLWIVLALAVGSLFAVGLPRLISLIPWSVEKQTARFLASTPGIPCRSDRHPEAAAHVQTIVRRLYPIYPTDAGFPLTVEFIQGSEVNAFATLGGRVYVYDGLLRQAESPEELAGVLAHEIEHVRDRHILQGVLVRLLTVQGLHFIFSGGRSLGPEITRLALNLNFSREQEAEADEGGLQRLSDAHIDVAGFEHFFRRAQQNASLPGFLSDHPASADRADLVRRYRGGPTKPLLTSQEWQQVQTICQ